MQSKPKSLYQRYVEESFGRTLLENETGFIVYEIKEDTCVVVDVFTIKEARRTGAFYKLCKEVEGIAKSAGCKKIVSFIQVTDCKTSHLSLRAQLALGMRVVAADHNVLRLEISLE